MSTSRVTSSGRSRGAAWPLPPAAARAPGRTRNSGVPPTTKSPTTGTISRTQSVRRARATSAGRSTRVTFPGSVGDDLVGTTDVDRHVAGMPVGDQLTRAVTDEVDQPRDAQALTGVVHEEDEHEDAGE